MWVSLFVRLHPHVCSVYILHVKPWCLIPVLILNGVLNTGKPALFYKHYAARRRHYKAPQALIFSAVCDISRTNWFQLSPIRCTSLRTHHLVRFLFGFSCLFYFCVGWRTCAGRMFFIFTGACKRNPFPPHAPKIPKTVMQSVRRCGIICGK